MLFELVSVFAILFFAVVVIGAAALLGSLLFDLIPVLRDGDNRLRQPLVFPEVAQRPVYRQDCRTGRAAVQVAIPLRAAA